MKKLSAAAVLVVVLVILLLVWRACGRIPADATIEWRGVESGFQNETSAQLPEAPE